MVISAYTGQKRDRTHRVDVKGFLEPLIILPTRSRCYLTAACFGYLYCPHSYRRCSTVHENMVTLLDLAMLEEHLPSGKSGGSNTSSLHYTNILRILRDMVRFDSYIL